MELDVGAGWNDEELRNHGTDPAHRFGVMRERVEAMKAIWTRDEAAYGDGWAVNQRFHDDAALMERIRELRERARAERGLDSIPVTLFSAPLDADLLRGYADAGVTRVVLSLRATPHDDVDRSRLDTMLDLLEAIPA